MTILYLPRAAAEMARLASRLAGRWFTEALKVRLALDPGGAPTWRLVATDGHVLGVLRGPNDPDPSGRGRLAVLPADFPAPGPDDPGAWDCYLPADLLKEAVRSLPRGGATLALAHEGGRVFLGHPGGVLSRPDGEGGAYPDYERVLPTSLPLARVAVNPDHLERLLAAARAVYEAGGRGKEVAPVTLCFYGPAKPLGVASRCAGYTFDGLLMPLTGDDFGDQVQAQVPEAKLDAWAEAELEKVDDDLLAREAAAAAEEGMRDEGGGMKEDPSALVPQPSSLVPAEAPPPPAGGEPSPNGAPPRARKGRSRKPR